MPVEHDREEQRLAVLKQRALLDRNAGIGNCRNFLLLEVVRDAIARHLVGRVPARADRDVERAGIEYRARFLPADRGAKLDGRPRAIGLVAGGVGAVEEGAAGCPAAATCRARSGPGPG